MILNAYFSYFVSMPLCLDGQYCLLECTAVAFFTESGRFFCRLFVGLNKPFNFVEQLSVDMLVQIDKLVQLIESPFFSHLRVQLLDPAKYRYLYKSLYGILMVLPQVRRGRREKRKGTTSSVRFRFDDSFFAFVPSCLLS